MKFIECLQGESEWYAARCGRITASCFADAVSTVGGLTEQQAKYVAAVQGGATEKDAAAIAGYKAAPSAECVKRALAGERTEDFSDTAKRYAADLSLERISRQPHGEPFKTWVLERGHKMEEAARRQYEGRTGSFVTEAGICLTDDEIFGYSTDGLVDDDGLIEIKAPVDSIKIRDMWLTGDTSEYDHQMQGGMWVTGRKWCDFIMYVPDLAPVGKDLFVKRVFRDDGFIDVMVQQLNQFEKLVSANEAIWREGYVAPAAQAMPEIPEEEPDFQEVAPAPAAVEVERTPIGQVLHDGLERYRAAKAEPTPVTPPFLRLGQINERLSGICKVSSDDLTALGFPAAGRDRAAILFHEDDFPMMLAAMQRGLAGLKQQYGSKAA